MLMNKQKRFSELTEMNFQHRRRSGITNLPDFKRTSSLHRLCSGASIQSKSKDLSQRESKSGSLEQEKDFCLNKFPCSCFRLIQLAMRNSQLVEEENAKLNLSMNIADI